MHPLPAILITLAGLVAAMPALAQDHVPGLACMGSTYDAQDYVEIDRYSAQFDLTESENYNASVKMAIVARNAVDACALAHGWSKEARGMAMLYEMGRLSEAAFRLSGPFTTEELATLDEAVAQQGGDAFWAPLEQVVTKAEDEQSELTPDEEFAIGLVMLSACLALDDPRVEDAGALFGLMAMQRVASREFAALQGVGL